MFITILRKSLNERWPLLANDIVLYKTHAGILSLKPTDIGYAANDRLVSVAYRATGDILFDYAKYIVCTVEGICSGELDEARNYFIDQTSRNRVFQLYLMEEEIFKDVMPPLSSSEEQFRKRLFHHDNRIDYLIHPHLSPPASEEERHLLVHLIQRRLQLMSRVLHGNAATQRYTLSCQAVHGSKTLFMDIARPLWEMALTLVRSSYLEFGTSTYDQVSHAYSKQQ
jgi:hypothetical protein